MPKQFGVKVCCSPDGRRTDAGLLRRGREEAEGGHQPIEPDRRAEDRRGRPLGIAAGEPLKLRVFVDKSVVEVFANGRQAVMRRIYPSREDSVHVAVFSHGDRVHVTSLEAWEMMPSNPY